MIVKLALLVCVALNASTALACDCAPLTVAQAQKGSDIVFRGTITNNSGGRIMFRVDRIWKGNIGPKFEMPELITGSACWGFPSSGMLLVGNDLVIFASRNGDEYFTSICMPSNSVSEAADTLKKLGPGRPPRRSSVTPKR